jgi:hypothetical protein
MKFLRVVFLAGLLAVASLGFTTGGVAAYGKADNPLAQIEYSANFNGHGSGGGIWLWIEIDGGPLDGTADVAGAGCTHLPGVFSGAQPIRGEFDWYWSSTPVGEEVSFGTYTDPNGDGYYVIDFTGFGLASFPVTVGHYSFHPAPGVAVELQVAPSGPRT